MLAIFSMCVSTAGAEGIEAFILSGYPHAAEADLFARHVLPRMDHAALRI